VLSARDALLAMSDAGSQSSFKRLVCHELYFRLSQKSLSSVVLLFLYTLVQLKGTFRLKIARKFGKSLSL
jgi:hypothetical protein